jgi:hypothetical protein
VISDGSARSVELRIMSEKRVRVRMRVTKSSENGYVEVKGKEGSCENE